MRYADFATLAALGTARRPLDASALPATLPVPDAPNDPGDGPDQALAWLDAAASWATARAAEVATGPDAVLDLPAHDRPVAPPAVSALLRQLRWAGGVRDQLEREALAAVADRGLTLPPDLLVELLRDLPRPGAPARQLARSLDDRGWALVALNPAWSARLERAGGAAAPLDPALWDDGTLAQRRDYLVRLRGSDPDAARALLAGPGWAKEAAEAREAFVRTLAVGLGAADEPFLDAALDDRAASVRAAAADLLARLPGSALVARAEAVAAAHLALRPRLLRAPTLVATRVPLDAALRRDGYPGDRGPGTRAALDRLARAIALVPTGRWPALLGATASELASGPAEHDGAPIQLTGAWAAAAVRGGDAVLARTLLAADPDLLPTLAPALPPDALAAELTRRLRGAPADYPKLAHLLPDRADAALTAGLLEVVEAWLGRPGQPPAPTGDLARRLALAAHPDAAGRVAARLQALAEGLPRASAARRALGDAASVLQLRAGLAEALSALATTHDSDQEGRR